MPKMIGHYPGYDQITRTITALVTLPPLENAGAASVVDEFIKIRDEQEAKWERAHDETYEQPSSFKTPLTQAVWSAMYPDTPYFETIDTMEIASMRVRVFDLVDAVLPVLEEARY